MGWEQGDGGRRWWLILALPPACWDLLFGSTFSWPLGGTLSINRVYCKYSFNGGTMAATENGWGLELGNHERRWEG